MVRSGNAAAAVVIDPRDSANVILVASWVPRAVSDELAAARQVRPVTRRSPVRT